MISDRQPDDLIRLVRRRYPEQIGDPHYHVGPAFFFQTDLASHWKRSGAWKSSRTWKNISSISQISSLPCAGPKSTN